VYGADAGSACNCETIPAREVGVKASGASSPSRVTEEVSTEMDASDSTDVAVRNLADLVRRAAAASPGKTALRFRDDVLSWADLDRRVDAVAAGLRADGLEVGDRVALLLGNTPDYVAAYFGILRAGCVAVPINTSYTAGELTYLLNDSGTRMALCGRAAAPVVTALTADVPSLATVLVTDTAAVSGSATFDELLRPGEPVEAVTGGEDLAVLMYTSGTSGRPKGAMLSHRALIGNLEQTARIVPKAIDEDDVVLLVLPLFHIYGLNGGLGEVAYHGATGVLIERFDPVETLAEIRRHSVTTVMGAPPMFVAWSMLPDVGPAFQTVRLAISGAAPLPPAVHRTMLESTGHYVFEGYGLTETSPVLTTTLTSEVPKPGSIGRPIPGVELRLLDDDRSEVEEDDPGEIVVRGVNLFSGYWPDRREGPDAEGWLGTGDVAFADEDGDLFLVDRMRELILVSGFNVYPREVEDVLIKHPDIAEAAVIGMPHPYTGESVKALVRLREGARLSAEDVIEYAAVSLARFKCPTTVRFLSSFPHTATGRVAKGQLREAEAAGVS
jgi:long-chain acyl-CoA synthetase